MAEQGNKILNLRTGEKLASSKKDPKKNMLVEVTDDKFEKSVDSICNKFREKITIEINKIVNDLKKDLEAELQKRDERIAKLVADVTILQNKLANSDNKITEIEESINIIQENVNQALAPAPGKDDINTVVAGDSIVKHVKVEEYPGNNELICIPGARSQKIHRALRERAETGNFKNLVLHFGTNRIPQQNTHIVAREIGKTLKQIQLDFPDTHIFLLCDSSKVPPLFQPQY